MHTSQELPCTSTRSSWIERQVEAFLGQIYNLLFDTLTPTPRCGTGLKHFVHNGPKAAACASPPSLSPIRVLYAPPLSLEISLPFLTKPWPETGRARFLNSACVILKRPRAFSLSPRVTRFVETLTLGSARRSGWWFWISSVRVAGFGGFFNTRKRDRTVVMLGSWWSDTNWPVSWKTRFVT